ncbi:RanGTP-binding protein [Microdochium nivale]|nr:RanGTP-binding protein [Microdochium nivale]
MDAFLTKLSQHATSFAIRSCFALTSRYVAKHAGSLLKKVDDGPTRRQLVHLQHRLARKIELLSPILESIEVRFTQGETDLEAIINVSHELRQDIDALEARILTAHSEREANPPGHNGTLSPESNEVQAIIEDTKELIANIDDAIPLVNLWVSSMVRPPTESTPFSPSRLLQASMLLNIADTQYILDPSRPMQVGPDFGISLYMLFRGHASLGSGEEPYGIEEGQRKPLWQQVMRKARVRLYRVPENAAGAEDFDSYLLPASAYRYQLQIVEDLDDGLLHAPYGDTTAFASFDGIVSAGLRQAIQIADISKLLYTEVGSLLNIVEDDGKRSNPVLLLKRETQTPGPTANDVPTRETLEGKQAVAIPFTKEDIQSEIDQQLFGDFAVTERTVAAIESTQSKIQNRNLWGLPANLDPEWMALEVYMPDEDGDIRSDSSQTSDDVDDRTDDHQTDSTLSSDVHRLLEDRKDRESRGPSSDIDTNLCSQFARMGAAPANQPRAPSTRAQREEATAVKQSKHHDKNNNKRNNNNEIDINTDAAAARRNRLLVKRSPFGAIKTSLSLLEMLLRLTSLQEFEQKTHLAIPDHLLRFYLDESASTSGLRGQQRVSAKRQAEAKMGFDPYTDSPAAGAHR